MQKDEVRAAFAKFKVATDANLQVTFNKASLKMDQLNKEMFEND